MELSPERNGSEPDYPTHQEYMLNRRDYLKRIAKIAGAVAISGVGIFAADKKTCATVILGAPRPPKPADSSDTIRPAIETRRLPGEQIRPIEPPRLRGKPVRPQPAHIDTSKTGVHCVSDTTVPVITPEQEPPRLKGRIAPVKMIRINGTSPAPTPKDTASCKNNKPK
jgi:hypothetical protein